MLPPSTNVPVGYPNLATVRALVYPIQQLGATTARRGARVFHHTWTPRVGPNSDQADERFARVKT